MCFLFFSFFLFLFFDLSPPPHSQTLFYHTLTLSTSLHLFSLSLPFSLSNCRSLFLSCSVVFFFAITRTNKMEKLKGKACVIVRLLVFLFKSFFWDFFLSFFLSSSSSSFPLFCFRNKS